MVGNSYSILPCDAADQYDTGVCSFALYHQSRCDLGGVIDSEHIDFQKTLMIIPRHLEKIGDFVDACIAHTDM